MFQRLVLLSLPVVACTFAVQARAQVPDPTYVVHILKTARVSAEQDADQVGRSIACLWEKTDPSKSSGGAVLRAGATCGDPISTARAALDRGVSWWTLLRNAARAFAAELTAPGPMAG